MVKSRPKYQQEQTETSAIPPDESPIKRESDGKRHVVLVCALDGCWATSLRHQYLWFSILMVKNKKHDSRR